MENASKASIHLRAEGIPSGKSAGSAREVLEFMALQGICKSFTTEVTKEYTKFAKLYFEALCFNEVAEFNGPVFEPLLQSFKSSYIRVSSILPSLKLRQAMPATARLRLFRLQQYRLRHYIPH